jgi:hypothetical protein
MVKISGGKAGSVSRLKKDMAKSSGGKTWIKNVRADEDMTVRFLTEPEDWYAYREHYDPDVNFFPCVGKDADCPGCGSDSEKVQRTSRRYLANVVDVESGSVVPLKLPLDLANRLVARYERNGDTLLNRDYTLHRMGKGLDTTYDVTPEDRSKFDISKHTLIDLEKALIEQFEDAFDLDEDEDEVKEPPRSRRAGARTAKPSEVDTDDDLDDEDEVPSEPSASADEDDEDGEYLTEEEALKLDKDQLSELAEQVGIEIDKRWSTKRIVDAIFSAAE